MYDFELRPKPTAEKNQRAAKVALILTEGLRAAHAQGLATRPPKPVNFPGGYVLGRREEGSGEPA